MEDVQTYCPIPHVAEQLGLFSPGRQMHVEQLLLIYNVYLRTETLNAPGGGTVGTHTHTHAHTHTPSLSMSAPVVIVS